LENSFNIAGRIERRRRRSMRPARYNEIMKEEQSFRLGEIVEVISGPFTKAVCKVRDVNADKRMLAVLVVEGSIAEKFGHFLIELKFQEVRKIASYNH
jgi:transcription antitermination factor NusG